MVFTIFGYVICAIISLGSREDSYWRGYAHGQFNADIQSLAEHDEVCGGDENDNDS